MSRQPLLIPIIHAGVECYQLVEDYKFCVQGLTFTIPMGLVVDGASVPRWLWWFKPPDGQHRAGSLVHDFLYINKGCISQGAYFCDLSRRQCDQVFRDMLRASSVSGWKLMYRGVRMGGWWVWSKGFVPPVILPVRNAVAASQGHRNHLYSAPQ